MDPAELERQMAALDSDYGTDSDAAARALGLAGIVSAIPALASRLCRDAAWELTDSACVKAEAIAAIGGDVAVATMVGLLLKYQPKTGSDAMTDDADECWRVHHACIQGLVQLGSLAIPALRPVLQHSNSYAAESAAEALGKLGDG